MSSFLQNIQGYNKFVFLKILSRLFFYVKIRKVYYQKNIKYRAKKINIFPLMSLKTSFS